MRRAAEASVDTWLITGGAGFIGSNFVRLALAEARARIVVLDKLTYAGTLENLAFARENPRFAFVLGDIADPEAVTRTIAEHRPRVVVNFAAESHVDRSIDGPRAFVVTNVLGCFELLEACRRHVASLSDEDRGRFRFLHVSTDEVFGALGPEGAFSETTPYAPNSPYAASKAGADHLVRAYHETYGLKTLLTNCSNNYGPQQFPEKLIPLAILNARDARPIPIYGDGLYVRDWLHVEDHGRALLAVLERGTPGRCYAIGGGNELTNLDLADRICALVEAFRPAADNQAMRAAGLGSYRELKRHVEDRSGHDRRYAIDASRIRSELSWSPKWDFDEGLRATVRWYLENDAWVRAVQDASRYERERLGLTPARGSHA
jgi:dTDP-glucose 4,6-dehydratase